METILNTKRDVAFDFDDVLSKCEDAVSGLHEQVFAPYNDYEGYRIDGWYDQLKKEFEDQIAATVAWTVACMLDLCIAYYDPRKPGAEELDQWLHDIDSRHPEWHLQEDWFENRPVTVPEYYWPDND